MINISLGDWFRLVLVVFHVGNALKHGLQNLIWIDILIKFPLNPHLKYTECFLVFNVKPGLVVRWYQNSELLGKPELLMLSIEETLGLSSLLHHHIPRLRTESLRLLCFIPSTAAIGNWSTSPCLWNSPSGPVCLPSFEGKHLPDPRDDSWAHPNLLLALRLL